MDLDLTKPDVAVEYLEDSGNEHDWNNRCDKIKDQNDGYPSWWFIDVLMAGVLSRTSAKWKAGEK